MGVYLLNDLISYWKLDESGSTTTRVDSHGSHDLSAVGSGVNEQTGAKLNSGTRGTQNTSNYLDTAHHDDFRPTDNGMTLSAWMNVPAGTTHLNGVALAHYSNTDRGWNFWARNASDKFALSVSNDGTTATTVEWGTAYTGTTDTWFHVVGIMDPANDEIRISVNRGTFVTAALTGPFHGSSQRLTHQFFNGSSPVSSMLRVDEMGAWKRILNSDELDTLYNGGGTPPSYDTFAPSPSGLSVNPILLAARKRKKRSA